MASDLSPAQCILLTVHYASEANIKALHSFTPSRLDALNPELVLRILLTYLPESTEPGDYLTYVQEVASRLYLDTDREDVEVDLSPVRDVSEDEARRKVKKLHLVPLAAQNLPSHEPNNILTLFLRHRAYRIDSETGLLNMIPRLIEPFLDRDEHLRTWYISVILPLLRLQFEYYSSENEDVPSISLADFEKLEEKEAVDFLLRMAAKQADLALTKQSSGENGSAIARDVKGLVGPWMYGYSERKRRKLDDGYDPTIKAGGRTDTHDQGQYSTGNGLTRPLSKISLSGVTSEDITGHDWEYVYSWLVNRAREEFATVTHCIENWDGPGDIDLGSLEKRQRDYLEEDLQQKLELQYAQAAFATCYAAQSDDEQTIRDAHAILARLAELLDFVPPPDLASSVDALPKIERHATVLDESQTVRDLDPGSLLTPEHPLTTPRLETYMLLQMMVYSAYLLAGLEHPISLVSVAKLHFYASAEDQMEVMRKMLRTLARSGSKKDETQWAADRAKFMWLWNWGIDPDDEKATTGSGVLGKIPKEAFEEEMLKVFAETGCYKIAIEIYLGNRELRFPLSEKRVEAIVLGKAMEVYDGASNGNKTRGGVKKASDIIAAFRSHFPNSVRFRRADALIAATHALSFYSLKLQHGVPFQPVSIRVSHDPIGLVDKVLEQNPRSYTKLDDLVMIGKDLVSAGLEDPEGDLESGTEEALANRRKEAERRVTFMAVEAALREDDFETAYSYIVNRLTPSGAEITAPTLDISEASQKAHVRTTSKSSNRSKKTGTDDDISWRAAFLAGRYRPATSSPPTVRRLEQRTELLSLALLLAPTRALTEILAVWRRCEEEMTSLQLSQQQAEQDFDDRADQRAGTSTLPGNFVVGGEQPAMVLNQKRREMGRMGASKAGADEAPMSMFDLTRSAARVFSQSAFPLRGAEPQQRPSTARSSVEGWEGRMAESTDSLDGDGNGQQKVRKRDMVANAVTGGLASGLGWVLGATPLDQEQRRPQQ